MDATGPAGRGTCLARYYAQIHDFANFGASTRGIGEARVGSHQADRMSETNLTESRHRAEARDDGLNPILSH
jgi:hypothetical protein